MLARDLSSPKNIQIIPTTNELMVNENLVDSVFQQPPPDGGHGGIPKEAENNSYQDEIVKIVMGYIPVQPFM